MSEPIALREYVLGSSAREQERLKLQASIVGRWTRDYLLAAGLQRGMRVLDIGTGMGDVALLSAEIVGPSGSVVGIDRDASVLQKATARVIEQGELAKVDFVEADAMTFTPDQHFDAVVGRYVLLYQPDSASAIRHFSSLVRPGGILCFHEMSFGAPMSSYPAHSLFSGLLTLVGEVFRRLKVNPDMGLTLAKAFAEAGLSRPTLKADVPLGGEKGSYIYSWAAETIRSLLPRIEQLGLNTAEEVQIDTLAQRLEDEALQQPSELVGPLQVGAWLRIA